MSSSPIFRTDLYRGTSRFYDEYRLPYPAILFDDLCRRVAANGTGRLIDLACGPGTATFPLSERFGEVRAVDQEPDAIAFAETKASDLGVRNVEWIVGRAEDVDPDEVFDVVTIGTAFHRLDRQRVAELAAQWLRGGGYIALLWSSTPLHGTDPWQPELSAIVIEWMDRVGAADRLPADLEEHLTEQPHEVVLANAGFENVEHHEFPQIHDWSVPELIGYMYSTSLLSRAVLGQRIGEFESDVEARLRKIEPSGRFREHASFAVDLGYMPPTGAGSGTIGE